MVARSGGYYSAAFTGYQGVTQGGPLSPTIFNVVVDVVLNHWVYVMVEVAEDWGKCGQEGRHHNALFCADDGMVASLDPRWLQGTFSTLVGLFDRLGLRTNVGKTVVMVCRPCRGWGTQSEVVYRRRMTGEGPSYRERQKGRVQCNECGEEMTIGSILGHMRAQHGRVAEGRRSWTAIPPG